MVVPEQFFHQDPTEDTILIDIIRERGSLNQNCLNVENQVKRRRGTRGLIEGSAISVRTKGFDARCSSRTTGPGYR